MRLLFIEPVFLVHKKTSFHIKQNHIYLIRARAIYLNFLLELLMCASAISSHSASKLRHRNICHSCLRWVCLFLISQVQGDILHFYFLSPIYYLWKKLKLLPYQKPSLLTGAITLMWPRRRPKLCCSLGSRRLFRNQSQNATQDPKLISQGIIQFHFSFFY